MCIHAPGTTVWKEASRCEGDRHVTVHHTWQILTAAVVNPKTPQVRNVISEDDFVIPRGLVNSLNDLILFIRVVKEGAIDHKAPRVGQMVHQDHPLCTVHISSLNLKDPNSRYLADSQGNKRTFLLIKLTFSCISVALYSVFRFLRPVMEWVHHSLSPLAVSLLQRANYLTHPLIACLRMHRNV